MDCPLSDDRQRAYALDHELDDAPAKTSCLGQVNGIEIEFEFLPDKENRWNKIFELLEVDDSAQ